MSHFNTRLAHMSRKVALISLLLWLTACGGGGGGGGSSDGSRDNSNQPDDNNAPVAQLIAPLQPQSAVSDYVTIAVQAEDDESGIATVQINGVDAQRQAKSNIWNAALRIDDQLIELHIDVIDHAGNTTDLHHSIKVTRHEQIMMGLAHASLADSSSSIFVIDAANAAAYESQSDTGALQAFEWGELDASRVQKVAARHHGAGIPLVVHKKTRPASYALMLFSAETGALTEIADLPGPALALTATATHCYLMIAETGRRTGAALYRVDMRSGTIRAVSSTVHSGPEMHTPQGLWVGTDAAYYVDPEQNAIIRIDLNSGERRGLTARGDLRTSFETALALTGDAASQTLWVRTQNSLIEVNLRTQLRRVIYDLPNTAAAGAPATLVYDNHRQQLI